MRKIFFIFLISSFLFGEDNLLKKAWAKLNELSLVTPEVVVEVDKWMKHTTYVAYYDPKTGLYQIEAHVPSWRESKKIRFFDDVVNAIQTSRTTFEILTPASHPTKEE